MDGDPDRKATGFSPGQLPESSAITPGGRDTYKKIQPQGNRIQRRAVARVIRDYDRRKGHLQNGTRIRVTFRDSTARQQVSASGASHIQPITPRRREYAQTYTGASGDSIRNAPDELV